LPDGEVLIDLSDSNAEKDRQNKLSWRGEASTAVQQYSAAQQYSSAVQDSNWREGRTVVGRREVLLQVVCSQHTAFLAAQACNDS
jgi:hypothetical protein